MQDKYEALAELMKDEETAKAVMEISPEEASVYLKERGLDFTVEELKALAKKISASENAEFDESDLDSISGGTVADIIINSVKIPPYDWMYDTSGFYTKRRKEVPLSW